MEHLRVRWGIRLIGSGVHKACRNARLAQRRSPRAEWRVHVRHRDRVQLSDGEQQVAPRRVGRDTALRFWQRDFELVREPRPALPALRAAAAPDLRRTGQVSDWDLLDESWPRCSGPASCRSWTSATSACPTGCRTSRTRRCRRRSPTMPARSRTLSRGCATTRPSTRCTSAPSSARSTAYGTSSAGTSAPSSPPSVHLAKANALMMQADRGRAAGRRVRQQRERRVLPALLPRSRDPPHRRLRERAALPAARPALRAARGRGHAPICTSTACRGRIRLVHAAGRPPARSILGVDYYEWNEKLIDSNGQAQRSASCSAGMPSRANIGSATGGR